MRISSLKEVAFLTLYTEVCICSSFLQNSDQTTALSINDWIIQHDSFCFQNIYYETEVTESKYTVTTD